MRMRDRGVLEAWPMTPALKRILIANAAVWLVAVVLYRAGDQIPFLLAMVPDEFAGRLAADRLAAGLPPSSGSVFGSWLLSTLGIVPGRVLCDLALWQPFTYMWLHSTTDFTHVLFNCLFLWMFGGALEREWGSRAFFKFYMICGVGAGLVVLAVGALTGTENPTVGASGAIMGLVVAWAITYPNRLVYLFGVIPMKGKHFALIPIGYAVLDFIVGGDGVSHSAHLGGLAIGALLVTGYWRPTRIRNRIRLFVLRRRLRVVEGRRDDAPPGGYLH